jgi:hypothetical protein
VTSSLNPSELVPISPVAATIISELFDTHPTLAQLQSVAIGFLAVVARYEFELRGVCDHAPARDQAAIRREFMYLENAARPLAAQPTTSAAALVAHARLELVAKGQPACLDAFDVAVATLVRAARTRTRMTRT